MNKIGYFNRNFAGTPSQGNKDTYSYSTCAEF